MPTKKAAPDPKSYLNEKFVKLLLKVIDPGLVGGTIGERIPGSMCVEAAVAYAMGEKHSDDPSCVDDYLRDFKICMNDDLVYKTGRDRARALRRIAVAQLGTKGNFDRPAFIKHLRNLAFRYVGDYMMDTPIKLYWTYGEKWSPAGPMKVIDSFVNGTAGSKEFNEARKLFDEEESAICDSIDVIAGFNNKKIGTSSALDAFRELISEGVIDRDVFIEDVVQILVKMKTPGSKFLYVTKKVKFNPNAPIDHPG